MNGGLGVGTTSTSTSPSVVVLANVTKVVCGYMFTCALMVNETVRCWGKNNEGQLGNGDTTGVNVLSPPATSIANLSGVVQLVAGFVHTCVVVLGGSARCWGANTYGQLGTGDYTKLFVPSGVVLAGVVTIESHSASYRTCALMSARR